MCRIPPRFPRWNSLILLCLLTGSARAQVVFPVTAYDPAVNTPATDDPAATNGTFRDAVGDANGSAGVDAVTFNQVAGGQLDIDANNGDIVLGEALVIEVDTNNGAGILVDAGGADVLDGTFNVTIEGDERLTLQDARIDIGGSVLALRETAILGLSDPGDPTRDHISDATAVQIQDTASLRLDDDTETIGSLAGAGTVVLQRTAQATELRVGGDNQNTTYSGVISGTNGVLRKAGTGVLTLTGANTHTGMTSSTILENGTIVAGNAQALGAGGFEYNGTGGDTLRLGGALTLANAVVMTTAGVLDTAGFDGQLSGVISGTGELAKVGAGVLNLSGNNTTTGGFELRAGTLLIGSATALGGAAGDVQANGAGTEILRFGGAFDIGNRLDLQTNLTVDTGAFSAELSGDVIGGGSLTKTGTGILTLDGAGTSYSGGTRISAGEIAVTRNGSLGTGTVTFGTAGTSLDLLTNGMVVANAFDHTADAIYEVNTAGSTAELTGVLTGTGALNKNGAGILILSNGGNAYGATTINAGVIRLGGNEVIPDASAVTIAGGAVLDLNANLDSIGSLAGAGSAAIGGSTLSLLGADTATFSGDLSGAGIVQRQGTGTTILSGASPAFTGLFIADSGITRLTGSLGGTGIVSMNGTLEGTGSFANALGSAGRVSPGVGGAGTLTTGADYSQGPAGTLIADVLSGGASDRVAATGDANLDGTLSLMGETSQQAAYFGQTFTVVTADGQINGAFSTVTDNLDFLTPSVTIDNASATSRVLVSFDQITRDFTTLAANENQTSVARALQESLATGQAGTDLRGVIGTLLSLPADQAQSLLQQMAGEVRAAAITATLLNDVVFTGRVMGQLSALRTDPRQDESSGGEGSGGGQAPAGDKGQVAAPAPARTGGLAVSGFGVDGHVGDGVHGAPGGKWAGDDEHQVWLLGTGIWGDLDPTATQQGFEYDGAGFVLGYSWRAADDWLVGVHAGFTGTNVDTLAALDKVETESFQGGLHLSWMQSGSYVDGLVNLVNHQNDSERFIQALGIDRRATAEYDADEFAVYLESGQIYELGEEGEVEQWHAQPQAAIHYRSFMQDAYSETGAGDLSLTVLENEADFFQTALGIRMYYTSAIEDGGWIVPDFMVRWGHEFGDVDRTVQSSFVGTDRIFSTSGRKAARDTVQLRAGVTAYTLDDVTVDVGYNGELADGQNNHAAVGRVVYKF